MPVAICFRLFRVIYPTPRLMKSASSLFHPPDGFVFNPFWKVTSLFYAQDMNSITVILSCLFFCLFTLILSIPLKTGKLCFLLAWMTLGLWAFGFFLPADRMFVGLLLFMGLEAACQFDLYSGYFSWPWFLASLVLCFPPFVFVKYEWNQLMGVLLALVLVPFWKKQKIGSADLMAIAVFGVLMGSERLIGMLIASCLSSLLAALFFRKKTLPFVSFLCFWTALFWCAGYTIVSFFSWIVV